MSCYKIAGFWQRIVASAIDFIFLGIIGYILGLIFKPYFILLGNEGVFIGIIISMLYFSFLNSGIGGGKTLGKAIMKLKVVDKNDNLISFEKSFLRALIIIVPNYLIGYEIPYALEWPFLQIIKEEILLFVLYGIIIFYILNASNRQSFHDILLGTFVVSDYKEEVQVERASVKKYVYYTYGAIIVAVFLFQFYFEIRNDNYSRVSNLRDVYSELKKNDDISNFSIERKSSLFDVLANKKESLICKINVNQPLIYERVASDSENSPMVKNVVRSIINKSYGISYVGSIVIQINYGYNIGIASSNKSILLVKSADEWMKLINR
ncbi:MAG: RDD family protein [Bacteroidota bacterium]|nr:RDD family protein [Bacteroidota bacterium]